MFTNAWELNLLACCCFDYKDRGFIAAPTSHYFCVMRKYTLSWRG